MKSRLAKYLRRYAQASSRFRSAQGGATAVEYALIAPVFIATLVALFQTCLFLFAQTVIQTEAETAARYFMTGQAQNGGWTATTVINKVCQSALFTCSNMYLVVQNYSDFASANTSAPAMYNGNTAITSYAYNPGTQNDIMVVQLIYAWPVVSSLLGFNISNLPNNQAQLMGVAAFRVEPY